MKTLKNHRRKRECTCQRTHVPNHAYVNKSRRVYVRDVRQVSNPDSVKKVAPFAPFIFDKIIYIFNKNKIVILHIIIISFGENEYVWYSAVKTAETKYDVISCHFSSSEMVIFCLLSNSGFLVFSGVFRRIKSQLICSDSFNIRSEVWRRALNLFWLSFVF